MSNARSQRWWGLAFLVVLAACGGGSVVPSVDSGTGQDAGAVDAGVDAGLPDAGERDAGAPDAGSGDAGLPDAGAACGDGVIELVEGCDDGNTQDGDGCSAACALEPGFRCLGEPTVCAPRQCGDGVRDVGDEDCDDGNLQSGDGCSAACAWENVLAEVEPNGTIAEAAATSLVLTGPALVRGGLTAGDDEADLFRVTLAAPGVLRAELFEGDAAADCPTLTTTLRVFDAVGVQLATDDDSGLGGCSAMALPLPAGTFYLQVEERGADASIERYALQVSFPAAGPDEVEPNDGAPTATPVGVFSTDLVVRGNHPAAPDSDVFAFTVPHGGSVRAELLEGDRAAESCESQGVDSRVTLYSPLFLVLADDDDSGRGFCSLLDGTGPSPKDPGAAWLPAGTYYLQVRSSPFASPASAQFHYRLSIVVR